MTRLFALFSIIFCISFINHAHDLQQLRLHFDVNKTIIATDAVQGKDLETTINGVLTEFTYTQWNGNHEQSYYAYITDQIAQEHPDLSKASEAFKKLRSERLHGFSTYLVQYPELLAQYEHDKMRMLDILNKKETIIFPSFYNAIKWLDEHYPQQYAVYLRTFGKDLPEVIPVIEEHCSLRFAPLGEFHGNDLSLATPEQSIYNFFIHADPKHYAFKMTMHIGKQTVSKQSVESRFLLIRITHKSYQCFLMITQMIQINRSSILSGPITHTTTLKNLFKAATLLQSIQKRLF